MSNDNKNKRHRKTIMADHEQEKVSYARRPLKVSQVMLPPKLITKYILIHIKTNTLDSTTIL